MSFPSSTMLHNLLSEDDDGTENPNSKSMFMKLELVFLGRAGHRSSENVEFYFLFRLAPHRNGDPFVFTPAKAKGYAYDWIQVICGRSSGRSGGLPQIGEAGSSRSAAAAPTFSAVVDKVRSRVTAWQAISGILVDLEKGILPPSDTFVETQAVGDLSVSETLLSLRLLASQNDVSTTPGMRRRKTGRI